MGAHGPQGVRAARSGPERDSAPGGAGPSPAGRALRFPGAQRWPPAGAPHRPPQAWGGPCRPVMKSLGNGVPGILCGRLPSSCRPRTPHSTCEVGKCRLVSQARGPGAREACVRWGEGDAWGGRLSVCPPGEHSSHPYCRGAQRRPGLPQVEGLYGNGGRAGSGDARPGVPRPGQGSGHCRWGLAPSLFCSPRKWRSSARAWQGRSWGGAREGRGGGSR